MKPAFFQSAIIKYSILILVVGYAVFTQFYKLGELAIIQWDESRLAVNAAEMHQSGKLLVTTYENEPDLFNTKPPLMIWLQALSIGCFGVNEFAIRFPAALAGIITILLVGWMVYGAVRNIYTACLAMVILTTCDGFIQLHGSITGDFDALLACFIVAGMHCANQFFIKRKRIFLIGFITMVALSLLTKSAAAILFFPVYYVVFFQQLRFAGLKWVSIALMIAIVPLIVFYVLRENAAPGYLSAIWENEFGGRFLKEKDGHEGAWHYYIVHLFTLRFSWWIWLLPVAMLYGFIKKVKLLNQYSLVILVFIAGISAAQTKLEWYDLPVFPFIAILLALFIDYLVNHHSSILIKISTAIVVSICMVQSIYVKFNFTYARKDMRLGFDIYEMSNYIKKWDSKDALYYHNGNYDAWLYFYTLSKQNIQRCNFKTIKTGHHIVIENNTEDSFRHHYHYIVKDSFTHVKTIQISSIK
ncbi:MAG: phospholipid carrier-dependent glycosyltransferase [Bacteroidota bacterium]